MLRTILSAFTVKEIRKKVLALPADATRVQLGKKLVGGCWDNVK